MFVCVRLPSRHGWCTTNDTCLVLATSDVTRIIIDFQFTLPTYSIGARSTSIERPSQQLAGMKKLVQNYLTFTRNEAVQCFHSRFAIWPRGAEGTSLSLAHIFRKYNCMYSNELHTHTNQGFPWSYFTVINNIAIDNSKTWIQEVTKTYEALWEAWNNWGGHKPHC